MKHREELVSVEDKHINVSQASIGVEVSNSCHESRVTTTSTETPTTASEAAKGNVEYAPENNPMFSLRGHTNRQEQNEEYGANETPHPPSMHLPGARTRGSISPQASP